jgi:hypothetical protein
MYQKPETTRAGTSPERTAWEPNLGAESPLKRTLNSHLTLASASGASTHHSLQYHAINPYGKLGSQHCHACTVTGATRLPSPLLALFCARAFVFSSCLAHAARWSASSRALARSETSDLWWAAPNGSITSTSPRSTLMGRSTVGQALGASGISAWCMTPMGTGLGREEGVTAGGLSRRLALSEMPAVG